MNKDILAEINMSNFLRRVESAASNPTLYKFEEVMMNAESAELRLNGLHGIPDEELKKRVRRRNRILTHAKIVNRNKPL